MSNCKTCHLSHFYLAKLLPLAELLKREPSETLGACI